MRAHSARCTTWVRACLLISTSVVVFSGLFVVCGGLVESGHRTLGDAVGDLDFAVLVVAFFFGPAWVTRALRAPWTPRNGGPPRGGIVPLARRTPGDARTLGVVSDRSDRAA